MNGEAGYYAIKLINDLKEHCLANNILIRVLRGTFSHDRLQNQFWVTEIDMPLVNGEPLVKVFDNLSIEHISSLDIDVLYCPDNMPYDDAYPVICQLLKKHQLDQVDIICNHGYFEHLLPKGIPHKPQNTFKAKDFEKLCKGVVLNGHIHTANVHGRIVTGGSFERLCHGEEELKGFFILDINGDKLTHTFIPNTKATLFKSFKLDKYKSMDDATTACKHWLSEIFSEVKCDRQHVRLITDNDILKTAMTQYIKTTYLGVFVSSKKTTKSDTRTEEINTVVEDLPVITEENIAMMIHQSLLGKNVTITIDKIKEELYG